MRLIYLTATMPFGADEAFFIPEVKALLARGCEVLIVPRSPSGPVRNRDAQGLEARSLPKPLLSIEIVAVALLEMLRHPRRCGRCLGWVLRSRGLSTLLKNLLVLPKGLWLGRTARKWQADHIHAHWAITTSTMAMVASEVSGIPWSFTAHRGDILAANLLELKSQRAALVRFIAEDGRAMADSACGGIRVGRSVLLHLGIELPRSVPQSRSLHAPPVILCPAHLIPRKGQRYLIEAVAILRDRGIATKLCFAGDGPNRQELEDQVKRQGLDGQTSFLGRLSHADLLDLYARREVDIVALPTFHEGIPVALMEAMAYEVPVISTPTGGVPELVRDDAGLLVPPGDSRALADSIEQLIADSSLRKRLSETGRKRVAEEFAADRIVESLLRQFAAAGTPRPAANVRVSEEDRSREAA